MIRMRMADDDHVNGIEALSHPLERVAARLTAIQQDGPSGELHQQGSVMAVRRRQTVRRAKKCDKIGHDARPNPALNIYHAFAQLPSAL